ncbi:NRPS-like enzyme [Sporothrix schenckii 1099-18]|uniref:NRPS-like enzyme n=1 Tax=Sporothrix schenckii 1099-18 TaxID=1397361 RepID=A0A0F2MFV1_SPOSC|nr:NRPS-like enzyme [Sporothrix schenckii 1099-18]KJR88497.1 NRPS-like enzyme [Sporothrix schenckii 1099-18]
MAEVINDSNVANGHINGVNSVNGIASTKEPSATAVEVTHHEPQQSTETAATRLPKDSSTLGIRSGPIGERLVVHVVDELAHDTADRVYATVTASTDDIEQGFRDITFRQLAGAVNATSWSMARQVGTSTSFGVMAYLGVSDIRYAVYLFAAIKTGHQLMIPSVRNALPQHQAVFAEAACRIVHYTPEMAAVVGQLKDAMPDLQAFRVPPLDDLLAAGTTAAHFPYTRTWAAARTDPIIIAHSSGSTGNPKPTTITNGVYSVYDSHRKAETIPGRINQCYQLLDLEGDRFFNPFPPFHLAGLFAMSIMPVFYACIVCTGPPDKPPSGALLSRAMQLLARQQKRIRAAWCPPAVIEQLADQPGGFAQIASLDWIMYTGGPLAPAVGDRICHVTNVCQLYGSTETGPHMSLIPLPHNWSYFEWHPTYANDMEPMGDGTFEMVVRKGDGSQDWIRHLRQAYPDVDVWRTRDLFVQSPHSDKLWRFVGRRDDVLVLSNGEKFNPVDMEGVVTGHPLVRGALIVGTARFQAALVVEPMTPLVVSERDFVDALWPTIEQANSVGPAHGRIFRSKVLVAAPDKPFVRAGKGTVIRGRTTKLFEHELDALYREDDDASLSAAAASVASFDALEDVTAFVRASVTGLFPTTAAPLADDDDVFARGLDSLQTLELTKILRRALAPHRKEGTPDPVSTRSVYAHPSIRQLAEYLHAALSGPVASDPQLPLSPTEGDDTPRVRAMKALVDKYTAGLPNVNTRRAASLTVAITGSTGSLGTHILEALLNDRAVAKIYCLNRSDDAQVRQQRAFDRRGKAYSLADPQRTEFVTVDLGDPQFGLDAPTFRRLRATVDVVIHNAWKVDFNHSLASFEDTHIRGVRHVVDFALASERQPHIFYVSSLSSVANWPAVQGAGAGVDARAPTSVPEAPLDDPRVALAMGYGESKHVAEQILARAVANAGLHATTLRVGQVAGPLAADGGQWNPTEWLPSLVRTSRVLGRLPSAMNTIEWIPVDALAAIVRDLVHHDYAQRSTGVYNLVNPAVGQWDDLVAVMQKAWPGIQVVAFDEWLTALQAAGQSQTTGEPDFEALPALKIMDFYRGLAGEAALPAGSRVAYETGRGTSNSATMAGLGPIDGAAMATWLKQWGW